MKRLFLILAACTFLTSCDKEREETNALCLEGTIQWGGDPAADGRGWIFVPTESTQVYYLKNLPEAYKQNNLQVATCLKQTAEKANCFCQPQPYLYAVTSIQRK